MLNLPVTTILLGLAALFVLSLVFVLLVRTLFLASRFQAGWSRASRIFFWLSMAALAILLLRPHEHTWQGLDSSAYRLMAKAFSEGRPLHGVDQALVELPSELRRWTLLLPSMKERNTRDRSFEIPSIETGWTQPFFYPLLPLAMAGLDACTPGSGMDYLLPLVGLVFMAACLLAAAGTGGWSGMLVGWAFLLGSPLMVWMFRGGYAEAAGGALLGLAWLPWVMNMGGEMRRETPWVGYLALGMAVSFHPVFLVLALPSVGVFFILDGSKSSLKRFSGLFMFGLGLAPLYFSTLYIAQPYGQVFQWSSLVHNFQVSASHRATMVAAVLFSLFFVMLGIMRDTIDSLVRRVFADRLGRLVLLLPLLWAMPTLMALTMWSEQAHVAQGLRELWQGMQWPFGALLGAGILLTLLSPKGNASRWALTAAFFALPVFLYLKGAEQMGFWSQRRLLPPLILMIVAVLPVTAAWLQTMFSSGKRWMKGLGGLLLMMILVAGLANPLRWPAPYLVRYEHGADQWLDRARQIAGPRLLFVDYHPWSVPLAVDNRTRVIGLSEFGAKGFPALVEWLGKRSTQEEVWWLSAYDNPGLELGIVLESMGREAQTFQRLRSKHALPAVRIEYTVDAEWIRVKPLRHGDLPPAMDKVFDRGPAGLRGPWGRKDIGLGNDQGRSLPAVWSREGSGIVGPVPEPGGRVRFVMQAASYQDADAPRQVMHITPPWTDEAVGSLSIGHAWTEAEAVLERPWEVLETIESTGVYRLSAQTPYDPSTRGIGGFDRDLGVLVHFIGIEVVAD